MTVAETGRNAFRLDNGAQLEVLQVHLSEGRATNAHST